jgi:ABC-2 type transport system permease protein
MNITRTFFHELNWLFRHKGALLILLGAPVLYAFFYPLPYQHAVVDNIPLIVWDEANSTNTRHWIQLLDAHPKLKVVERLPGEPNEQAWQTHKTAQAFVYFPADIDEKLAHQQPVHIAYGGKADNFLVYSEAMKAIALTLSDINKQLSLETMYIEDGNAITAQASAAPIETSVIEIFNGDASYIQYLVPAVFVLIVQQVLMIVLGMHWGYRFELNRPVGNVLLVWNAHIVIYGLQGLALIAFFFRVILPWQGIPFVGDAFQLFRVSVPFVLAVIGFAMVVSVGFREQETSIIWLLPVSVPILLMAGVSWPTFAMQPWVQILASWVPSTWGVNAITDVAFLATEPDYFLGWRNAFVWLTLGLLLRQIFSGNSSVAAPSTV